MAFAFNNPPLLFLFSSLVICSLHSCLCFRNSNKNFWPVEFDWSPAGATWYGSPNGAGSDGGACAYGNIVEQPPFSSMVSAGGSSLFKAGKGCGACYQVKCTSNVACSGEPVTVVITDNCPGGPCLSQSTHFDMSGTAFGAMAVPAQADQLRNVGMLQIEYKRVACNFAGQNIAFFVDSGSNPYYLSVVVEYTNGDGDLGALELKEAPSPTSDAKDWIPMQQSWGANWKLTSSSQLQPPFSIKLTSLTSCRSLIVHDVIPVDWKPGQTYRSLINFEQ